jgi:bifunctional enzyme CysN/CysC
MVTGASTANLAAILIDARRGVVEQTRRHAFIASLLRIPHLVVCVNKMDLVDWSEDAFEQIRGAFQDFAARLETADVTFIPMSALHGDNVVERSTRMPWYQGPPLLHHLEHVHIASDRNLIDCRFPVQWIARPQSTQYHDYRGYAGQVAAGVFRVGDEIVALPAGFTSRIEAIDAWPHALEQAFPPLSITIRLSDDLDIGRGDMICRPNNRPEMGQDIDAMIVWMSDARLAPGSKYTIKHTTSSARCLAGEVRYRLNIQTLHREEDAGGLGLNEIGRVAFRTTRPLFYDEYRRCKATGSFILIDESSNGTVGAGMIIGAAR